MQTNRNFARLAHGVLTLAVWAAASLFPCGWALGQDYEAEFHQALHEFQSGKKQEAAAALEEILKTRPDHAPSHELLGLILSSWGDNDGALLHLREATRLWPRQLVYWTNLGIFYLSQSRTDDAVAALVQSLELDPNPPALRLLGLIRLDQNAGGEAVQYFRKALELAPDDTESWYYLGLAQHSLAHSDEALHCYEEVLKRDPHHFHAQLQMGTLLLTNGQREQALPHLLAARLLRPQDAEVFLRLTEAYLGKGDLPQALESARRAVELTPADRQTHYHLGLVLARMGKRDESAKEFAISEGLPKKPEITPLERWRQLHGEGFKGDESKP